MTLHVRKVDDRTLVEDGTKPVHVPAGWNIAPGDADDMRVCGAHPWQSNWLVFADTHAYGTAMCHISSFIGTQPQLQNLRNFFRSKFSHAETGKKSAFSGFLKQDAQGVRARDNADDVLLRRRA
jgi:hypothetical protein